MLLQLLLKQEKDEIRFNGLNTIVNELTSENAVLNTTNLSLQQENARKTKEVNELKDLIRKREIRASDDEASFSERAQVLIQNMTELELKNQDANEEVARLETSLADVSISFTKLKDQLANIELLSVGVPRLNKFIFALNNLFKDVNTEKNNPTNSGPFAHLEPLIRLADSSHVLTELSSSLDKLVNLVSWLQATTYPTACLRDDITHSEQNTKCDEVAHIIWQGLNNHPNNQERYDDIFGKIQQLGLLGLFSHSAESIHSRSSEVSHEMRLHIRPMLHKAAQLLELFDAFESNLDLHVQST